MYGNKNFNRKLELKIRLCTVGVLLDPNPSCKLCLQHPAAGDKHLALWGVANLFPPIICLFSQLHSVSLWQWLWVLLGKKQEGRILSRGRLHRTYDTGNLRVSEPVALSLLGQFLNYTKLHYDCMTNISQKNYILAEKIYVCFHVHCTLQTDISKCNIKFSSCLKPVVDRCNYCCLCIKQR